MRRRWVTSRYAAAFLGIVAAAMFAVGSVVSPTLSGVLITIFLTLTVVGVFHSPKSLFTKVTASLLMVLSILNTIGVVAGLTLLSLSSSNLRSDQYFLIYSILLMPFALMFLTALFALLASKAPKNTAAL